MLSPDRFYWTGRTKKKEIINENRIRCEGGGRKSYETHENIDQIFLSVISEHIAGDPMNDKIKWVKLPVRQISIAMKKKKIFIGKNIVRKLLKKHGFVKRKIQRKQATGQFKDRDDQFQHIEKIKAKYIKSGNPIISIDTKKKEKLGNLHRQGEVYCTQALESYDHDYAHLAEGTIVPHGIYDVKRNEALITIGTKNETAKFICDSMKNWWNQRGKKYYPTASEILVFCDAGGANSYRHHVFKSSLQTLANAIALPIRICHYPPYTSKWNPIEHRVFPHVTRAMAGVKLESVEDAKKLIKKTTTQTGLKVFVNVTKKVYEKGIKVSKEALEKINITRHGKLGQLNYTVAPTVT